MYDSFMERPDFEGTDGRATDILAEELSTERETKFDITLQDADVSAIESMHAITSSREELFVCMAKLVLEVRVR